MVQHVGLVTGSSTTVSTEPSGAILSTWLAPLRQAHLQKGGGQAAVCENIQQPRLHSSPIDVSFLIASPLTEALSSALCGYAAFNISQRAFNC